MARTQKKVGGFEIELIQPLEGDSIYRDFLKDNGEGVQHLGWHFVDSLKTFHQTTLKLEQAGFSCLTTLHHGLGVTAYFDTTEVLYTILEVSWRDPSVTSPPRPIHVFPESEVISQV